MKTNILQGFQTDRLTSISLLVSYKPNLECFEEYNVNLFNIQG